MKNQLKDKKVLSYNKEKSWYFATREQFYADYSVMFLECPVEYPDLFDLESA